jgi:hypothetical protein
MKNETLASRILKDKFCPRGQILWRWSWPQRSGLGLGIEGHGLGLESPGLGLGRDCHGLDLRILALTTSLFNTHWVSGLADTRKSEH